MMPTTATWCGPGWCDPGLIEWAELPELPTLVDPATLTSLITTPPSTDARGADPVVLDRIRIKPGLSAVLSWHTPTEHGWAALLTDPDKIEAVRRRAMHVGEPLLVDRVEQQSVLLAGRLDSDPGIARELGHARRRLRISGDCQVLAHNPGKRVVAAVGLGPARHVVRISARRQDHLLEATRRWRGFGAPVLPVRTVGRRHTAVASPWWGHGDLSEAGTVHHAELAGRAVAEVHRASAGLAAARPPALDLTDLVGLLPAEHERIGWLEAEIEARTGSGPVGLLHGDLSPDQILVASAAGSTNTDTTGTGTATTETAASESASTEVDGHEIRIIDLDRAATGPAAADVGSWLAACDLLNRPYLANGFLAGWGASAADRMAADLSPWRARAVLAAAIEPFRQVRADWRTQITARLDRAESLLTQEKR